MEDKIRLLSEIRNSPRKLHKSYLESIGILEFINSQVP